MKSITVLCAGFALAGAAINAPAAAQRIRLPPETAKLKPAALPGYMIAMQKCATCHSADYISYQPPSMGLSQWTAEVGKMQHIYGAPLTDDDVRKVGAYLAVSYGNAKLSDLPVELRTQANPPVGPPPVAAAANGGSAPPSGKVIDAKALLAANNCLSCHAIDKKIVGPAYHDVALRYKNDPQALSKLEASIRNGVSGKWGTIPMPPFSQLKPEEVHALAEFVRKQ